MRTHLSVYPTGALLCNEGGSLREKKEKTKMRGRRGGEEGERGGGGTWGQMTACKDFLCVGSRFLQRASCCQEAWLSLTAFLFCYRFYFLSQWLTILATTQAGPREDRGPKGGPFRSYDCGVSAPFLPPRDTGGGAQVFTDLEGPGVARAWVLSLLLVLAFRGGGQSKPLKEESSVDLRAPWQNRREAVWCGCRETAGGPTGEHSSGFSTVFFLPLQQ